MLWRPYEVSKTKSQKMERTYLKLALCKSLPPSAAGTLPLRELPLRFLFNTKNQTIKYHYYSC